MSCEIISEFVGAGSNYSILNTAYDIQGTIKQV